LWRACKYRWVLAEFAALIWFSLSRLARPLVIGPRVASLLNNLTQIAGASAMANKFHVYTAPAIAKIQAMKAAGKSGTEIAHAIGTTRGSLSARMSQLGITKAKQRSELAA
jgi:hypothetical protein